MLDTMFKCKKIRNFLFIKTMSLGGGDTLLFGFVSDDKSVLKNFND